LTEITGGRNQIWLNFPNGAEVSITWGACTYSDNYDSHDFDDYKMRSSCAEVSVHRHDAFARNLAGITEYAPVTRASSGLAPWCPIDEVIKIINWAQGLTTEEVDELTEKATEARRKADEDFRSSLESD
jgi:hypothetical protein